MRAVSGGWQSPNLQTKRKENIKQVKPALRLLAKRYRQVLQIVLSKLCFLIKKLLPLHKVLKYD
jgi:hypothetical protein